MNWPGEGLLMKLWETLAERGVGGLLRPWQIKRDARANIEARHLEIGAKHFEIVALADAEKKAEDIRAGRLKLVDSRYTLVLPPPGDQQTNELIDPTHKGSPAIEIATAAIVGDALRREVNVAKAITYAEAELKDDSQVPPETKIEADWLYRWRDYAGAVSSDELQTLWGRLLAGELKEPGAYSCRTLEFIRNLSTGEAKSIERLAPFVITDFIARDNENILEREEISFATLLELQELGVISGVESIGLSFMISSDQKDKFVKAILSHGRCLIIRHDDPMKTFTVSAFPLTAIGRQLMKLGKFAPHEHYLRAVGATFKKNGATVSISSYHAIDGNQIRIIDEEPL